MSEYKVMSAKELLGFVGKTKNASFRILVGLFDAFVIISKKEIVEILRDYLGPGAPKYYRVEVIEMYGYENRVIVRISKDYSE